MPSTQPRNVEIKIFLPEWLPIASVALRMVHSSGEVSDSVFLRGQFTSISLPLSMTGGNYSMIFSPFFVPAAIGLGEDQRQLCAILRQCVISGADGERVSLFSENISE